jgi:hypothetical protein
MAVTLSNCKDDSGVYAEQLYTNSQKDNAIRACLDACADTAVAHLCSPDGFYNYNDQFYRIDYASLQGSLFDTLTRHGYGNLIDSLILRTNRLAESCGSQISTALHAAIDSLPITDYDALVKGDDDAITSHFELHEYRYLKSAFQSPVSVRMSIYRVSDIWNEMLQRYVQYTPVPLNFDIQNYIVEDMLESILSEMSIEEELVRTDSTHRNDAMKLLGE